jgi:transposase-like protein
MAKRIAEQKRSAIVADLRRGALTHQKIAEKHGVSQRTVDKVSASRRDEPADDPVLDCLDKLVAATQEALEVARCSDDSKKLADAVRVAHTSLQTVAKMRAEIERQGEGGSRDEVQKIKAVILDELRRHPDLRRRIADRLLGATP